MKLHRLMFDKRRVNNPSLSDRMEVFDGNRRVLSSHRSSGASLFPFLISLDFKHS